MKKTVFVIAAFMFCIGVPSLTQAYWVAKASGAPNASERIIYPQSAEKAGTPELLANASR